jgi:hypothetical protein
MRLPSAEELEESRDMDERVEAVVKMAVAGVGEIKVQLTTWEELQAEAASDAEYQGLVSHVTAGGHGTWPVGAQGMAKYVDRLSVTGSLLLFGSRVIVPLKLRGRVLASLHSGHQGVSSMTSRAMDSVWWPGLQEDIHRLRLRCRLCEANTPTQPRPPPTDLPSPLYPFQQVCADYFMLAGAQYCVVVDRFSGWPSVFKADKFTSAELVSRLRDYFVTFGAPEEVSTDGASQFTSREFQDFLRVWGVRHRVSSAYFPHSNQRAELGVKTLKRIMRANIGAGGSLETDVFARALLQFRNTPDRDTHQSPAQVVFGRQVRDFVPVLKGKYCASPEFALCKEEREKALGPRQALKKLDLSRGTRILQPLLAGTDVMVQNQTGVHSKKWDQSGCIVEALGHRQYRVRMDATGRLTLRARQFLRPLVGAGCPPLGLVRDASDRPTLPLTKHVPVPQLGGQQRHQPEDGRRLRLRTALLPVAESGVTVTASGRESRPPLRYIDTAI